MEGCLQNDGDTLQFLGVKIEQNQTGYAFSQSNYREETENGLISSRPITKFKEDGKALQHTDEIEKFRNLLGRLSWVATRTRLDVSFAFSHFGQYMCAPTDEALKAIRRTWGYLKSSQAELPMKHPNEDICYYLRLYSDASYSSDSAKAVRGGIITIG
eukprot:Filipodium_phascolosomae@DN2649_c0_g1_i2.p1